MAVTVTATHRTNHGAERISHNYALALIELSLTGTYAEGGFSFDLDGQFRAQTGVANALWFKLSDETVTTNGDGLEMGYDRVNNKIKLYTGPHRSVQELYAGTELGTTGLSVTKLVILAFGYNA